MLGSSCSIPRPGRACSGYLVSAAQTAFVIDFGSGSCANLARYRPVDSLDGIVISHMHADHFLDLVTLRYALRYGARSNGRRTSLHLPPGGSATLRRLVAAFPPEAGPDFLDVFDVGEYDPEAGLQIGSVRLRFTPTRHYVPTYAIRCDAGAASLTYSADTAPASHVSDLADSCGALLCEATLGPGDEADAGRDPARGHLFAREAGALAAAASARRLLVTHYPASAADGTRLAREAANAFAGPISVVDDGDVFTIES